VQKGRLYLASRRTSNLFAEIKDSFQMLAADAVAVEIDYGHGRMSNAAAR